MNITIRLYKLHDYDLLCLYKNIGFPIKDAIAEALRGYVRNVPVFFEVPVCLPKESNVENIKSAQLHMRLDEDSDKDVIEYLSTLKKYYRNSFLKNLLRGCLAGPAVYVYEPPEHIQEAVKRNNATKSLVLGTKEMKLLKIRKYRKSTVYAGVDKKETEPLDSK